MRNISLYISRKLITSGDTFANKNAKKRNSPIHIITITALALGMFMLIIAFSVLFGFKNEIIKKLKGFSSDAIISNYEVETQIQNNTVQLDQATTKNIKNLAAVKSVDGIGHLPCIIRTNNLIEGIVLKGITPNYDLSFYEKYLQQGRLPILNSDSTCNEVMLSKNIAEKLNLKLNTSVFFYIIQNPPRLRKLKLVGIYHTGLEEFDKLYAIVDIKHIQKLNNWPNNTFSFFEITSKKQGLLAESDIKEINKQLPYNYTSTSLVTKHSQLFSWLALQDVNVLVILVLISLICSINLIAVLLVTILENTENIGILKSIGTNNAKIIKIFLWHTLTLISKGLIFGNLLGIGFCVLQYYFHLIPLDETSYYIAYIPIDLCWDVWLILNACAILLTLVILLIPALAIAKINPVKALRFK